MEKLKKIIKKGGEGMISVDLAIRPNDGHSRSKEKAAAIARMAKLQQSNRSQQRLLKNAMLSIQYKIEQYIGDDQITYANACGIEDFVKEFLKVLGINKTAFAQYIEVDISNLNKYYRSDRKLSTELALKFAHFFHTPADLWLRVQIKNELMELQKEKEEGNKYDKYDYIKILQTA